MDSYLFYLFGEAPGSIPAFEVIDCADDADAIRRCNAVLAERRKESAEAWRGDRMVCQCGQAASATSEAAE